MADFAGVEYPPVTVVAVEDDEDQLNLTSLTSVRYMRPFGCVVLVSLLLVYIFLISNATRRRKKRMENPVEKVKDCLLYTSPSPRDLSTSRMPSSA